MNDASTAMHRCIGVAGTRFHRHDPRAVSISLAKAWPCRMVNMVDGTGMSRPFPSLVRCDSRP
jgi:hypothetical protein